MDRKIPPYGKIERSTLMALLRTTTWNVKLMALLDNSIPRCHFLRHCWGAVTWDVNLSWHCLAIRPKMSTPYDISREKWLEMLNIHETVWKISPSYHYKVLPKRMDPGYRRSRYCLGETTRGVACNIVFFFKNLFRPVQNWLFLVFALFMILINAQRRVAIDI